MRMRFALGREILEYEIDRQNKKYTFRSSRTFMQPVKMPWKYLFDKGTEAEQEKTTDTLSDDDFILALTAAHAQIGYKVIKVER